jgi:hypothetical protein
MTTPTPGSGKQWRLHERLRSALLVARTQAAWAALLAGRDRADDRTRARDMAQRALATATAGGYGYVERDARAVLEQLGSHPLA